MMIPEFFQKLSEAFPQSAITAFFFIILGSLLTNLFGYVKGIFESKDKRIESMQDAKLDQILERIADTKTSLTTKIDKVETSLKDEISKLDAKIDRVETSLEGQISKVETSLKDDIRAVDAKVTALDQKVSDESEKTRQQINGLGKRLELRLDDHDRQLAALNAKELI